MVDSTMLDENVQPKKGKLLIVLSIFASLAFGIGGYLFVSSDPMGIFGVRHDVMQKSESPPQINTDSLAFVALDPIMITFGSGKDRTHLRFRTQLEVPASSVAAVEALIPRVIDVFNTFLRALTLDELQAPAALTKLRAQMLRRARIVLGDHQINDVLVMEFVLD